MTPHSVLYVGLLMPLFHFPLDGASLAVSLVPFALPVIHLLANPRLMFPFLRSILHTLSFWFPDIAASSKPPIHLLISVFCSLDPKLRLSALPAEPHAFELLHDRTELGHFCRILQFTRATRLPRPLFDGIFPPSFLPPLLLFPVLLLLFTKR